MTNLLAGRGLRALPRPWIAAIGVAGALAVVTLLMALVLVLRPAAQHPSGASGGASSAAGASGAAGSAPGSQISGTVPGFPTDIGGVHLVAAQYAAADILDRPGGVLMSSFLTRLAVDPTGVHVTVGVDMNERLSIGVWEIPGVGSSSLRDAWRAVAGTDGWQTRSVGGADVLAGADPTSGHPAYVMASDGRLVYVVSTETELAQAALEQLR